MAEQKAFKPTPKRLEDARKKGKVLKSQLLTQSAVVAGMVLTILVGLRFSWVRNRILLEYGMRHLSQDPLVIARGYLEIVAIGVAAPLVIGALFAVATEVLQVGFKFEWSLLAPSGERSGLGSGIKKIGAGFKQGPWSLLKISIFVLVLIWFSFGQLTEFAGLLFMPEGSVLVFTRQLSWFCAVAVLFLLIASGADYLIKRKDFYRDLSMSADEVRREVKDSEGDPLFKGHRKAEHQALLLEEIKERVRKSKVIVVERS